MQELHPARDEARRDDVKEILEILFLLLSSAVFSHQGVCEAGTPVTEYKGMLGFMRWTKWLQVKLHGITDHYKSLP